MVAVLSMKRKVALIQPYFGNLPNYFGLALKTYEYNSDFDWYIFTDDQTRYDYPRNVFVQYTTLDQLKHRFQRHFPFPLSLERPYKLCDYKPLYGHLFAEELADYEFWGHFDPDVLFGRISNFISDEIYRHHDKLFLKGHFSLYRNTSTVNLLYQERVPNCLYYQDVLSSERNWGFGERNHGVNAFFPARKLPIYTESPFADIYFRDYAMRLMGGGAREKNKARRSCFAYERGGVYRYYWSGDAMRREEFMYIHLMKRKMDVLCGNPEDFLIYGNAFRASEPITKEFLESANTDKIFYQFFLRLYFTVYTRRLKPACRMLFVERNYRRFIGKLFGRGGSNPGSLRRI